MNRFRTGASVRALGFPSLAPSALLILVACGPTAPVATSPQPAPSAPATTPAASAGDAMLPVRYDPATGRAHLTIRRLDTPMLYLNTLAGGLGTGGLDRGQLGESAVVRFQRHGARVLLIRDNTDHRAVGADAAQQRTVAESFPSSVLAALPVLNEGAGGVVVDATDFLLSDVYDVVGRLRGARLGTVRVDRERSYIDAVNTRSFPTNTEVRAVITYASDDPSQALRRHTPEGRAVTLQQHHSFVQLPERELAPRAFDPRTGVGGASFFDFAQPFDSDYRQRTVARWRLEPRDTAAYLRGELVEPVKPIVYYLDRGIPEPYRSAFLEGGNWWNSVFEAAGWRNAFRVELLPEGVDPMDARYPAIYWVHRQERGPSVGPSHRDPRTGEILTTVVRMDTYRSLVDHDIYMGLVPAAGPNGLQMTPLEFSMARRRQHAAHEIGHTLGLPHNFMAAAQGRTSVMDYPYPLIRLDGAGGVDISQAFRPSGGAHDTLAIRYTYTWYPNAAAEAAGLRAIAREAEARGLRFITGGHASASGSYPEATQWIEGENMLEALERTMAVRRRLIEHFDQRAAQPGEPLAVLNRRFSHVYLHHRYALEAATKYVGGMRFGYALSGEPTEPTSVIPAGEQRRALRLLMANLSPAELRIPDRISALIPPVPFGFDNDLTAIPTPAGTAFDPVATAHSLAQEIVDNLLHPERAARMVVFQARSPDQLSLAETLATLEDATWGAGQAGGETGQDAAIRRAAQRAALDAMLDLAGSPNATAEVRAITEEQLQRLRNRIATTPAGASVAVAGHRATARRDIDRYFAGEDDRERRPRPASIPLPWP